MDFSNLSDLWARIVRRLQGEQASKSVAKSRLQLVLVQDRMGVDSAVLESLQGDLVQLLGKYFEIGPEGMDVHLQREGQSVALIANIPILSMKGRPTTMARRTAS